MKPGAVFCEAVGAKGNSWGSVGGVRTDLLTLGHVLVLLGLKPEFWGRLLTGICK